MFIIYINLNCQIASEIKKLAQGCSECDDYTKNEIFCRIQSAKTYLEGAIASARLNNASDYDCAKTLFQAAQDSLGTITTNCCQ